MGLRLLSVVLVMGVVMVNMKVGAVGVPGGLGGEKAVTPEIQTLIDPLKSQVEEQVGHPVSNFEALSYKSQVVAGMNYFVKVDLGDNEVAHLRVYRGFDGSTSLTSIEYPKGRDHPITYF